MLEVKYYVKRLYNKLYVPILRKQFQECGYNVVFSPFDSVFSYKNIIVGNHVNIGYHADFVASRSKIKIGNHVVFGPHVSIRGGNHRTDIVGRYVDTITDEEKLPENDEDVIFEGDNWIGMNVMILKGVTIGKGCIIGANSVVTHSTPPYTICAGNPAKVIKERFEPQDIVKHIQMLNEHEEKDINSLQ